MPQRIQQCKQIRSGSTPDVLGHAYATGSDRKYDSYSASQTSDLDEIIQEIARNDQILELQQKLSSGEIEHEKQVSTMALLLLLYLREEVFITHNVCEPDQGVPEKSGCPRRYSQILEVGGRDGTKKDW